MNIDYDRIAEIIQEHQPMDLCERYYLKDTITFTRSSPLAPSISQIITNACRMSKRVLDVGCGRGRTLLDNAHLFEWGAGQDESAEHMIVPAIAERDRRNIRNVDFFIGKATLLLFEDDTFDLVFSERGPLGHHDGNLIEALRVLRPGGLLLIETGWDFVTLQIEKDRLERHGVEVHLAATFTQTLEFPDCYEFVKHQCITWTNNGFHHVTPTDRATIDTLLSQAMQNNSNFQIQWGTILLGGRKPAENALLLHERKSNG